MPVEDPDTLDDIREKPNGKPILVVIDSRIWDDDDERWTGLLDKLRSYIGYIYGDEFAAKYPGLAPREVEVEVVCTQPPGERMKAFTSFAPRGDETNRIPISYTPTPDPTPVPADFRHGRGSMNLAEFSWRVAH